MAHTTTHTHDISHHTYVHTVEEISTTTLILLILIANTANIHSSYTLLLEPLNRLLHV